MASAGRERLSAAAARVLGLVTRVERSEVGPALLLCGGMFLVLAAYYLIKPAREGWLSVSLFGSLTKIELKAYSSFGQVILLALLLPAYTRLVSRWPRARIVSAVTLFLTLQLVAFWLLHPGLLFPRVPFAGVLFYLWVGVFNVFIVSQFWAYVADFYTRERGRRLIPLVALGANAGAVVGAWLAERLVRAHGVSGFTLLLLAALPLLASLALLLRAERVGPTGRGLSEPAGTDPPVGGSVSGRVEGAFELIRRYPLLVWIAASTAIFGWVGANGENLLFASVQTAIDLEADTLGFADLAARDDFVRQETTGFYGNFYFWVNLSSLLLQSLVASRLLRVGGFASIWLCLPLLSVFGYLAMAIHPVLAVIKTVKVAENATNYSIQNTARGVLWLPTSSEMKFKAKQVIDTVFVRTGDGLAALTVLIGVDLLGVLPVRLFWLNAILAALWVVMAIRVLRAREAFVEERG